MSTPRTTRSTTPGIAVTAAAAVALGVCLLSLLAAVLWFSGAYAADGVELTLRPAAAITGEQVRLADVAAFSAGDGVLWEQLAGETLCLAPALGSAASLARRDILGRLAQRGYDWRAVAISGAERTEVTRATQVLAPQAVFDLVGAGCLSRLGVTPTLELKQELQPVELPAGELALTLRFPAKDGYWLPDAVECRVNGRLATVVPLLRYCDFKLPVVVAVSGMPARAQVLAEMLGLEERTLAPGQEIVARLSDVVGLTTRSGCGPGALVKLSRLQQPYDVQRGAEVTLIITSGGVQLAAQARALNSAYIGQSLLVERVADGVKFTGTVGPGPQVVVQ